MKKQSVFAVVLALTLLSSCVSKKKYLALQQEKGELKNELTKTQVEKEDLEARFSKIQERVDNYNSKIGSLTNEVSVLTLENNKKMSLSGKNVISNDAKNEMRYTLQFVDPNKVSQAKTLKDSMDLAIAYNLEKKLNNTTFNDNDDIAINVDETVVMISISDKLLFNSGSFHVSSKANNILQKLADVINSEPSLDVMVEGHTDSRSINTPKIRDNWDLSVLRATSIVRKLQKDYGVSPEKLIASGRSSYQPLSDNSTREGRSKNRRTRIVILPNIDKFFAMMASN